MSQDQNTLKYKIGNTRRVLFAGKGSNNYRCNIHRKYLDDDGNERVDVVATAYNRPITRLFAASQEMLEALESLENKSERVLAVIAKAKGEDVE